MDSAADEISQKASITDPAATCRDLDRAVEPRHHSFNSPLTNASIATERQHTSLSSSIKPESGKLVASINTTDAETLVTQTRAIQSWNNRSSFGEELERGHDFHRLFLRRKRKSMQETRPIINDRDHLPCQSQPSPATSLSRYHPSVRMVYVHRRRRHCMGDDTARLLLAPTMCAEESHSESAISSGDITNHNDFVEDRGFNKDLSRFIDESVETTSPIFTRHRRNQKTLWQMEEPVLQYEPMKRSSYDEQYFRSKSEWYIDKPVTPHNERAHLKDLGNPGSTIPSGSWNVFDSETFFQ